MEVKVDRKIQGKVLWYLLGIYWRIAWVVCFPVMVIAILAGKYINDMSWGMAIMLGFCIPGWLLAPIMVAILNYLDGTPYMPWMYENLGLPVPEEDAKSSAQEK